MLPPTAVLLNSITFNAPLWRSGSDKDSTSPFTLVLARSKIFNLDMERKIAMSPWTDVKAKSTCWSSVRSFHSGTKVPVTTCKKCMKTENRKTQMRQTTHSTCPAVRGLLKIRKGRILFHFMSFPSFARWSHSVRACTNPKPDFRENRWLWPHNLCRWCPAKNNNLLRGL